MGKSIHFCHVHRGKISQAKRLQIAHDISKYDGKRIEIIVQGVGKSTNPQRRYWYGVIVKYVGEHVGESNEEQCSHDVLDELIKINSSLAVEHINKITGEVKMVRPSWKAGAMSKEHATDVIETAFRWAAMELGLVIPSPQEYSEGKSDA